jgi:hypothetical protein
MLSAAAGYCPRALTGLLQRAEHVLLPPPVLALTDEVDAQ